MATTTAPAGSASIYAFVPTEHTGLIPYLAALHASCITHDRTVATFLPPLSHDKLLAYWKERIAEVSAGTRIMLLLVNEAEPGSKLKGPELMGVVMLAFPYSETGAMRGFVEKLLVSPKFRRRGAARALMLALEEEGRRRGKTLFMVDTETGSAAEEVYKKFGYVEIGKIPGYSISPDGSRKDETFFYKQI